MKKLVIVFLTFILSLTFFSNFIPPIDNSYLTSAFAEFRSTGDSPHFHGGIDFSSFLKEGIPIKAVYDGYLVRIEINDSIYGNVVVLQHPNGYRSVYAHLSSFSYKIQPIVDDLISEFGTNKIIVNFPENEIIFSQGEVVAYTGKTGEAIQPHVHVEIRNSKETMIFDPMGFIKPKPLNGEIVLKELVIDGQKYDFVEGKTYEFKGKYPRLSINAFLQVNKNIIGLKEIKLYFSNKLVYHIMFDEIPMEEMYKPFTVYTKDSIAAGYIYKAYYKLYPDTIGYSVKVNNFPTLNQNLDFFPVTIELYDPWERKKTFNFNLRRSN
ncbi:M23 family metallopeptidase [Thermosipho atlanticus]|uniref:Peptidase family M23 n=1 Tax=Thermosipho atlanticus DSM 15807 TaxID=1123380 RepID=A0A1M5SQT8_9BACT|nr:M23 family metallopeptidase [Thermosipho atlanticus]SHH40865.1 Peptidase family M23 [Thermosipho atlanticus DSM 15807]